MLAVAPVFALSALASPQAAPPASARPRVALEIVQAGEPLGTVTLELLPDEAPLSVANFLQYVREGHYDGTIFHRVMPSFMVQGGGLTPDMKEKPQRPPIRNEARNRLRNSRGAVAMARTEDPGSATSQFFVNVRDNHNLDFGIAGAGYAVFGRVVGGMEVIDRISQTPTTRRGEHQNVPRSAVVIERAYGVEAPGEDAAPEAAAATPPKP